MFFRLEKLETRVRYLEHLRYSQMKEIFPFEGYEDIRSEDEVVKWPAIKGEKITINKHHFILGRNKYVWLEKKIVIPAKKKGFKTVALFDMGKTGAGHNSGFESILYIDGTPYQAVDTNHKEVFFEEAMAEKETQLSFMLWSGLEGGGVKTEQIMHVQQAEIGYIHEDTDEFYFLGKALFKTVKEMDEKNELREVLLTLLDKAFLKIDLSEDKEIAYEQISKAYIILLEDLEKIGKRTDVTVHCVGHTHIDVAWLWRLKHTKEKCLRSFSTVLRYMNQFTDYKFIQSQPQLYAYVKENYPEFYEKMKEHILEGRFEADGSMWVEADCNISSGEALVRQILEGTKFFEGEFGKRSTCLWLPDVFGYSVALPQILKQFNINRFMTTKISWNEYNKMPHDTFVWRGMDGSEVLTYFITTPEEGWPTGHKYATYNGQISPRTVIGTWNKYEDKSINKDLLISYGYGDGGGGPTRTMLMMRRALDKVPGIPHVKNSTIKEFFDKVELNIKQTENYVHTWSGELYLENHRGTYTSQAYNKLMNRKMEYALVQAEAMGAIHILLGGCYEQQGLQEVWRILLLNQFHDIIPGSSIEEVYKDSKKQYAEAFKNLQAIEEKHLSKALCRAENTYAVFNFTPSKRTENILIEEKREGIFKNQEQNILKAQRIKEGYKVALEMVPVGFTQLTFEEAPYTKGEVPFDVDLQHRKLTTPYYIIEWNEEGVFTCIYDKENDRQVLKDFGNKLVVFEDRPFNNDAWNIDIFHTEKYEEVTELKALEIIEQGELELHLKLKYTYRHSTIEQDITFYSQNRRIDFATEVDWHETHRLLKTCFDVDIQSQEATYDIQFGNVKRPTHFNTSWDYAKFEVVAHKWVDLSETGYGVSLLNNCKYGHSIKDSTMNISLIKCATFPDTTADQGKHTFTYALLPHKGTWQEADVHIQSEFMNQKVHVIKGSTPISGKALFSITQDNIAIDAIKKAENSDNLLLRVHEYHGKRTKFKINSDFGMISYTPVNMLEEAVDNATDNTIEATSISDYIKPYEIKNYLIRFNVNEKK